MGPALRCLPARNPSNSLRGASVPPRKFRVGTSIQEDVGNEPPSAPDSENFVAEFALAFVRVLAIDVDAEIEKWLGRLVLQAGADRSSVAQILNERNFYLSHSFARPGFKAVRRSIDDGLFPWACAKLRRGEPVIFNKLDELPPDAGVDRDNFVRFGVKSQLSVPLVAGGVVIGVFSVSAMLTEREWPSEIITRMHLLGSVLANALARQQSWLTHQQMQEQLTHLARVGMAGELAASLAHELTQPLAAILTNAQAGLRFLARDPHATDEIEAILRDIVRDDKRAGAVISGLRAMMRKRQSERERVDMSRLVEEILAMLNMNIQAQRVEVHTNLEPDCCVLADKAQMQQVLLNLVVNALEAMQEVDEDNRRLLLEVRNGSGLHCAVHDSGNDLAPDQLTKIFEPFWTTKTQGMGMGLAVCRSIIDAHHGAIWAEIGSEGGAIFRFDLPKDGSDVRATV